MTYLELPEGSRARQLFDQLENQFQRHLAQLPPGLEALARQQGTYYGDFTSRRFEGLFELNPVLVSAPWLFWDLFEDLEDGTFTRLSEAGAFFVLASVVLDHLIDGQTDSPGLYCLYHQALYSRGVALYRQALPPADAFWDHFERLATEHLAGLDAECLVQAHPASYSYETLKAIAHGKVAPIVTTLAGFCAAACKMTIFTALEESLKHISIASQLLDDIGDWQEDLQNRHLTYFLASSGSPEAWSQSEWPKVEQLQPAIQAGWSDVIQLKRVMQGLNQAIEAVHGLDCPAWIRYVDGYRAITDGHLERAIRQHLRQVLK